MKIAICAMGSDLDSQISLVFGRAPFLLIFDLEKKELKSIPNPGIQAFRGAGVATSQIIVSEKIEAIIAGNFGPNAAAFLQMSGVKLYPIVGITAKEAVEKYKKGELKEMKKPTTTPPGFGFQGGGFGPGRKYRKRRRGP